MSFPRLPLLDCLVTESSPLIEEALSRTLVVAVQHLLETTGSLFEMLLRLGLRPENTFILGKAYSTNPGVADRLRGLGLSVDEGSLPREPGGFQNAIRTDITELWNRALNTLRGTGCTDVVILDDGGRCISMAPDEICKLARVSAVEQTTSGVTANARSQGFRVIEVATSAAKRYLESPMVSRAVLRRLPPLDAVRCGVIGVGNVGRCVASHLAQAGHDVITYDRIPARSRMSPGIKTIHSLERLVGDADVILGCSGDDVFAGRPKVKWREGTTTLISCSSEDVEYRSLLAGSAATGCIEQWTAVGLGVLRISGARLEVLRGGFPFNFDGSVESVPATEIQLTRALLLGGVLQAALCRAERRGERGRMLDPRLQSEVARRWITAMNDSGVELPQDARTCSGSVEWMAAESGGRQEDTSILRRALRLA